MSDVADVNRAHLEPPPKDSLDQYLFAAKRMKSSTCSLSEGMAFRAVHTVDNVLRLGERIDALRAENAALLDLLYGANSDE